MTFSDGNLLKKYVPVITHAPIFNMRNEYAHINMMCPYHLHLYILHLLLHHKFTIYKGFQTWLHLLVMFLSYVISVIK